MLDKLKALWVTIKAQLADIWNRSKMFIIAIGIAVAAFEWEKIKAAFLLYTANKEIKTDKKEDQSLAAIESTDSKQADDLVQKAKNESNNELPIGDDWNKK